MGAWGAAAWENDRAADWFGDTFDATGLAQRVEETLSGDPEDDHGRSAPPRTCLSRWVASTSGR
jgi:hypothetical protein